MFKDKQASAPMGEGGQTIIAQGVRVEGDFHANGDVVIDGEVTGSVHTTQALTIGPTARIQADVSASTASIAGRVQGNIKAADRLELLSTSQVEGDIETGMISVASGAQVNGRITMDAGKAGKGRQGTDRGKESDGMETQE